MTLLLALTTASATSICVPELFQHWACDQTAATLNAAYQAIDGDAGPHTIHLRWDVDETTLLDLDGDDDLIIIGHPGPGNRQDPERPELPRIRQIKLNQDAQLDLRLVEVYVPTDQFGIEALGPDGHESHTVLRDVWFVHQDPTHTTNKPMVRLSEDAQLTATRTHWSEILSDQNGAHIDVQGGHADLQACTLSDATGMAGGSINAASLTSVDVADSTFTGNTSLDHGGGAIHLTRVELNVTRTRFEGNHTANTQDREGGGAISINNHGHVVSITESLFCSNTSASDGGAFYKRRNGSVEFDRTVFRDNDGDQGALFYTRDDAEHESGAYTDLLRISASGNESSNNDDGIYVDGYAGGDSDKFDYLTVRESILEVRGDSYWHIEGGREVEDNRFSHDDILLSTDGTQSGNIFDSPAAYLHNACSFAAYTPPCSDLQAVDHVLGAVLSCSTIDSDSDGLMDHEEEARATDPSRNDIDNDSILDGIECPPAATDPLTNPGFEAVLSAGSPAGAGNTSYPSTSVPGWRSNSPNIVLSDTSEWSGLSGSNSLRLAAGQTVTQLLRAEPGESLVFRARLYNPLLIGAAGLVTVRLQPEGNPPGDAFTTNVLLGTELLIEHPFTMPEDGGVVELILEGGITPVLVDDVYLGPNSDSDGDGTLDCFETDSDDDGVSDLDEVSVQFTDPTLTDTDGDSYDDLMDPDPLVADLDGDGLSDHFEEVIGTNPAVADSDGDGVPDGVECTDAGVVNGGFEYRFGAPFPAGSGTYPPSELPGWTASPASGYLIGAALVGQIGDTPFGDRLAVLRGTVGQRLEQTLTGLPAGDYHWTFSHRGRHDEAEVTFGIADGGSGFNMPYTADDRVWETRTGVFSADGSPLTLAFQGPVDEQSYLDGIALYPASSVAPSGHLFCLDFDEQPGEDLDGDGYISDVDCNDHDPHVFPGAPEVCNTIDDDCDGTADEHVTTTYYADDDGDDFGTDADTAEACALPAGFATVDGDCDDHEPTVYPTAVELCDGLDNNCDGQHDEGLTTFTHYLDIDGDGWGGTETQTTCDATPPSGYVDEAHSGDCDDQINTIYPGAPELCNDIDDDCDANGEADEGLPTTTYYLDDDGDGWGVDTTTLDDCAAQPPSGYVDAAHIGDCDDTDHLIFPGQAEACNDIDDDCDNDVDEGIATNTYYLDVDHDTFGDPAHPVQDCDGTPPPGTVDDDQDCNDADPTINPGATEECDTVDNDCNNLVDDGLPTTTYYTDADQDGYGTTPPVARCEDEPPTGLATTHDDCNDNLAEVNPGAQETCEAVDYDCDGNFYQGAFDAIDFYLDLDLDGFGSDASLITLCTAPAGYVPDGGDCADGDDEVFPGAEELCNDVDDDCNGQVDDNATNVTTFFLDDDNDQFGQTDQTIQACDRPDGYAFEDDDCDDAEPTVYPGAPELCDDLDNDCDGLFDADEAIDYIDFYPDGDGDGYGDEDGVATNDCVAPTGQVGNDLDCDDADPSISPTTVETCDGVDSNCSGDESDATNPQLFFDDVDGDGWGDSQALVFACEQPSGTVTTSGDCNDDDPLNAPGGIEVCDGQDNNCNGAIDSDADTAPVWYQDSDDDGFGIAGVVTSFCTEPPGFTDVAGDCDDEQPTVYPDAPEICDGQDNDCDGLGDLADPDGPPTQTYFPDADGDSYGDGDGIEDCAAPSGYAEQQGDCDDDDDTVYPGAPEECTGLDNNCDGTIDDLMGWIDDDGDGFGAAGTDPLCNPVQAIAPNDLDCRDDLDVINPDAEDECGNGVDEDCDGVDAECPVNQRVQTGCKCDAGGAPPSLLGGILLLLVGLRRRRGAA